MQVHMCICVHACVCLCVFVCVGGRGGFSVCLGLVLVDFKTSIYTSHSAILSI